MGEEVKYEMSLNDLVSGKLDNAEKHAQKFETRLGSVQSSLGRLGEKALSIAQTLGISFAFIKLEEFAHAGVEAAHMLNQAEAQVKAGLISTNYAAGVSFEYLEESARKFAKVLPYSRAEVFDMQAQLLTFPGVTKNTFNTASQAILDMSTRLHKGLNETAIMVGKALQDPERGITAMRRVGVNFNEEQTKIIKKLVETGHAGQAQALILKELQTEFAGSAKAAADADPLFRYNKLMGSLKMAIGETGEALLHDLTPGLEMVAGWLKTGYEVVKTFSSYLRDNMVPILKEVKQYSIALGAGIATAGTAFLIANPTVIIYTGALILNGIATAGLTVATYALTAAQWAYNAAVAVSPIGWLVIGIGALVSGLVLAYQKSEKFRAVLSGLGEIAKDIGGIFKGLGEQILGALTFNPQMVMKGFQDMASSFHDIGSAFHRGYTESMAASKLEEEKEKHQTTMGKLAEKGGKKVAPAGAPKPPGATSRVTGSKTTIFNIKIDKLGCGITIKTTNLPETSGKVHEAVLQTLLSAVNDMQIVAGD